MVYNCVILKVIRKKNALNILILKQEGIALTNFKNQPIPSWYYIYSVWHLDA